MAVARSFRDGWLTSLKVDSLRDDSAELFLFRLGLKADKNGVHFGDPELLRAAVYPLQVSRRRLADVTRSRNMCVEAGLLRLWTAADGRPYVQILNFRQRTPNEKPLHPLPPGDPDDTGQEHLALPEPVPLRQEVNESKGRGRAGARRPALDESQDDWLTWLQSQWPQLDVKAELVKALRRKPDLERLWFAEHWLPHCSPKVSLSRAPTVSRIEDGPEGWLAALLELFPTCAWAPGGLREGSPWSGVPAATQAQVREHMRQAAAGKEVV